ncbi:hypothetical protein MCOR27_007410 [Pyricularia oryzae]|uniref:RED-like N-terminal domain-containing protein n=1 Tax=Pyricularia grisea TaxID=148305 RepID=A0ABQ8P1C0_PYRGI|nr:hypothetical protein MCOR01_007622 [Pyricularia oryzae]KAI6304588.1 hypothetical protein MCOR33_000441 [Pyricularia grisea]KAI6262586.1 hypothetical protein MCOR19_001283 [Pyricularia oryzae]KAI6268911.1 hypothetical protein MCOR26_008965 [Pyricularia oryzae]KAI6274442.1 hypothetical protein MCOR27_007410 [Pyricularia oryzae]
MNNDQFRRLIGANGEKAKPDGQDGSTSATKPAVASALGSRLKSSIPMTPRSLGASSHNLFAKQLAERDQANQKQKRFRTSAPKGSRLAEGYVDRARLRNGNDADAERDAKLKAIEKLRDDKAIDEDEYEARRKKILAESDGRPKGLDFELLAKARKGESAAEDERSPSADAKEDESPQEGDGEDGFDDALEQIEGAEVQVITKEKIKKKGQFATKPVVPGGKRSRDQILAELKAAREAAKAKEEQALGNRFKKIGSQKAPGTRFERDSKGREVMIIVDEDGHEKRKVRKLAADELEEKAAFVPDKNAEVLGMEVPEIYKKKQEEAEQKKAAAAEEDDDIFNDVGDYNPLAGMDSDSDDSSDEEGAVSEERPSKRLKDKETEIGAASTSVSKEASQPADQSQPATTKVPVARKDWFKGSKTGLVSEESRKASAANDPAVLAALRKAKSLNAEAKSEEEKQKAEREERLKRMLKDSTRDAEDMDMGFGTSRMADEEDLEERDIKLSAWGNDGDDEEQGGGKAKRKRGGKKRKGDVNSAADVLQVMERQKASKE